MLRSPISDEEKAIIRNTLIQNIEESVSQVSHSVSWLPGADHLNYIICHIMKFEENHVWLLVIDLAGVPNTLLLINLVFLSEPLHSCLLYVTCFYSLSLSLSLSPPSPHTHTDSHTREVANQMAVLIARIARLDCPDHWPNLLPVLSEVHVICW